MYVLIHRVIQVHDRWSAVGHELSEVCNIPHVDTPNRSTLDMLAIICSLRCKTFLIEIYLYDSRELAHMCRVRDVVRVAHTRNYTEDCATLCCNGWTQVGGCTQGYANGQKRTEKQSPYPSERDPT